MQNSFLIGIVILFVGLHSSVNAQENQNKKNTTIKYKNNLIVLQPIKAIGIGKGNYLGGNLGLERIFLKGYLGIKAGGFISYDQRLAGISYEVKSYPFQQKKFAYYVGVGGKSGLLYHTTFAQKGSDAFNAFQILNGVHAMMNKFFLIGINTGIGMGFQQTNIINGNITVNKQISDVNYNVGVMVGVRF